jgi:predicted DNA-binding WGR domain protein
MRRFEQKTEQGTRFWEVDLVGTELTLRSGKVGRRAVPDEREESYRNAAEARRELERLVKSRLAAGWSEVVEQSPADDVEDALARDDEAQWLVFADRLLSQGDVRGELITLQHSLGKKRDAKKQVEAFVARHDEALLGALAPHRDQLELTWRFGYLREAGLACAPVREFASPRKEERPVEDLLPVLLHLESARFLRTLKVGWPESASDCTYEPIVDLLARESWPRHLEALVLGDFSQSTALAGVARFNDEAWLDEQTERDLWPDLRSLAPLAPRLASLKAFSLRANLRRLGLVSLPNLTSLELHVQHLEGALVDELLRLEAPRLEAFVVECPHSPAMTPGSFGAVLSGQRFPGVTRLGLGGLGPEVLEVMLRAQVLPRLRVVDLSGNELDDDHARWLLTHREAFAHLDKLVLRRNVLSKAATRELKAGLPCVDVAHQRSRRRAAADDRFDDVGE